jgi:hypothetical protein
LLPAGASTIGHAEDLGAHIDLADLDQPPRPQLKFAEAVAIGAQGHFVIGAGGHVAEMRRRNVLLRDRLEVENVQRLRGVGNQFIEVAWSPVRRIGWPQPLCQGASRQQRARRQKLQQAAAADEVNMMRRHGCPPKQKIGAQFDRLSECNPDALRYDDCR